ncbi:hypothetical protein ECANGB1_1018 [Enterospora canceri]|uniref:Uncharacterized protein n=1 Tax=Enterospora canceri TaxID=1081671 RepID=A0A1Y1S6Z3_9MICR|nr:hypothetical protein ECANGB1_1018 [Enterospora canceri]
MPVDFILVTNERDSLIFECELNCESLSPLAMLVAYSGIENKGECYDSLVAHRHVCAQGCKIVLVTSRPDVGGMLIATEKLLNRILLRPEVLADDWIDESEFETKLREIYVESFVG